MPSLTLDQSSSLEYIQPQGYDDAQKQLLRVLAHHLVLVGKKAQVLNPEYSETQIIEDASCQWKRRATFEWQEMPTHGALRTLSSARSGEASDIVSQCRYHLSRSHTVTDSCRPVGGFGTCIKDVDFGYFRCGPSPMDQLLASVEQLTLEPRPHGCSPIPPDIDLSSTAGLGCGCCSISDTTISTPPNPSQELFQRRMCQYCQNSWLPYGISIENDVCQSCALLLSGNILPLDDSVNVPPVPDDNFYTFPSWDEQNNFGVDETTFLSTSLSSKALPSLDRTLDQLGEVNGRLNSLNLLV